MMKNIKRIIAGVLVIVIYLACFSPFASTYFTVCVINGLIAFLVANIASKIILGKTIWGLFDDSEDDLL